MTCSQALLVRPQRPFDSAWKFSRVTVREDGRLVSYLKGAPEVIIDRCTLSTRTASARQRQGEQQEQGWHERGISHQSTDTIAPG